MTNENRSEQFAQAIQPLTGMSASQFATEVRRNRLDVAAQHNCKQVEAAVLDLEQAERKANSAVLDSIQQDLYVLRKHYKKLGC